MSGKSTKDYKDNPEFQILEKEIADLSRQLHDKMLILQEKFPTQAGRFWVISMTHQIYQSFLTTD